MLNPRYLITNRLVLNEVINEKDGVITPPAPGAPRETIRVDGREEARERLRFGFIPGDRPLPLTKDDPDAPADPNDLITLYPHTVLDDPEVTSPGDPAANAGSGALFTNLYRDMCSADGGDALVFVHGYNLDLADTLRLMGVLENRYLGTGSPVKHLVVFAWPARSSLIKYRDDVRDTLISGRALGRAILKLGTFFRHFFAPEQVTPGNPEAVQPRNPLCGRKIHLLAHSSGVRVLEHAMRFLGAFPRRPPTELFAETILAAADVDNFALEFDQPLTYVCSLSRRVHSYNHKNDLALVWSSSLKNPYPRLGKNGVRNTTNLPANLVLVDVTDIKGETTVENKFINHWYYYENPTVVADMIEVFKGTAALDIAQSTTSTREPWPGVRGLYYLSGEE
jgi:esterase/lipase superfamily enzyme